MSAAPQVEVPSGPAASVSTWVVFRAMLGRDLRVLAKSIKQFLPTTIIQPLMLVFVFTYLFPRIGQAVGGAGGSPRFSMVLMAGVVAQTILFLGIFSVGMNVVRELDITGELDDRVLAPTTVSMVAIEKMVAGAIECLVAALIVLPVAAFVPATPISLHVDWPVLLTVCPLACLASAALGLSFGTLLKPRSARYVLSSIALPLAFLGAIHYPWPALRYMPWLQYGVLVNPLVYMSEGLRAALTDEIPHMSLLSVYGGLVAFTTVFVVLGVRGFERRMLT